MLIQLLFVLKLETAKSLYCFVPDLRIISSEIRKNRLTHELQDVETGLYLVKTEVL